MIEKRTREQRKENEIRIRDREIKKKREEGSKEDKGKEKRCNWGGVKEKDI